MQNNDSNDNRATFPDVDLAKHLFGEHNGNLKRIADALDVKIQCKGKYPAYSGRPHRFEPGKKNSESTISAAEGRLPGL